ncbi:recombinase family protein [Chelatococcus sambhunathii]|uniref:Recombinase family protein n=1 Tax=Chelatococcus sambhunathii TaxID=363953 RepID=A0ABU1DB73_9HYPH|nr:recombinase family protein [Chelatococcus sambhunathii]MDR4305363.1 recombinase family protein [Chelatococcus sambhunathii]
MASRTPAVRSTARTKLRCAVYTRKSSEEGLEQEFNSLDAQREACEAYVASQRHEGWMLSSAFYDDGGYSGGSMERPALQRLLVDIAAGEIDVVVVYKVDRLTRALSDFARIVELFDKHRVSFVSVTQAFNTTTSMGRLTLNVLLSFAQFEREVTGERIRDKIAASKKKGMWMGGQPPLGYDVRDRKLVINEAEAATVRSIFRKYVELRSVRELKAELDASGVMSKLRTAADGSPYGGKPLSRGALYLMLSNRIYRGDIVHKAEVYPGEHSAIVDEALFVEAQKILADNRVERTTGTTAADPSLLAGLVYDASGERLPPSHAVKKGVRYRYYVSHRLVSGVKTEMRGLRLPAPALEQLVRDRVGKMLGDPAAMMGTGSSRGRDAEQQHRIAQLGQEAAARWPALPTSDVRGALLAFVPRIDVHPDRVDLHIDPARLQDWLIDREGSSPASAQVDDDQTIISVPARLKQRGNELRFVVDGAADEAPADDSLIRLVTRAQIVRNRLIDDRASIDDVAREEQLTASYVTRLVRISFLAPDIVAGLLGGRYPDLTASKLMADTRFPLDWQGQREALRAA